MLLEIAIQVIALHINLKKNRKHQAVSIHKYFPSTCNFILCKRSNKSKDATCLAKDVSCLFKDEKCLFKI
jgi:histidinol-phosphate/aromatic aminotransferase/cobyric acid decarboxylase-like protein